MQPIENTAETPKPESVQKNDVPLQEPNATNANTQPGGMEEDPNWKAFREARKKDRAEREAAEKRAAAKEEELAALKAAMEAAFSKNAPTPQAYQQYYGMDQPQESEEERIEKKVAQIIERKEAEYARQQMERERIEYPKKLMRDFPDFNQVCSTENLDYLDFHFPEISRPLQRLDDNYEKWHDIYKAVKRFIPNNTSSHKDAQRAEMNALKPKSISAVPNIPAPEKVPESWQAVEQRRQANWERMQRTLKST